MVLVLVMDVAMVMHGCRSTRDAVPLIEDVSLSTGSEAVAVESDHFQRSEQGLEGACRSAPRQRGVLCASFSSVRSAMHWFRNVDQSDRASL